MQFPVLTLKLMKKILQIEDPILRSIKKYEKHPSIIKINSSMNIKKK